MKICLIFTPNQLNPNFRELAFRDDNIGFVPPLSLLTVAAILEQENVTVALIDMEAEQLSYTDTLERIRQFAPDMLGFTLTTTSFRPVLEWINRFKNGTSIPVLVGGDHVRLFPQETMSHDAIDYCIVGEAELPLPEFVRAWKAGKPLEGIKSLGYKSNGRVIVDRTVQTVADIDSIPFPARHLIKNELYENILANRKNFTAMMSARGCPFNCAFCNANHQKYRARTPRNFVDEIEFNLSRHGIHYFDIYDSTFTTDRERVFAICEEIIRRKLDVSFSVRSRVDVVSREMIRVLKSAGCHAIMYGIESSNQEILRTMNKGILPQQVMETVSFTKQCGIETLGFFMFGFPGETRRTMEDTIRFALELPLDYAQFTTLLPFPETEIYTYYMEHGLEDYWSTYTLDPSKDRLIELIGTEVTRQEASAFVSRAYKEFYFRSRIILNRLKRLSSLKELKKLFGGAVGILAGSRKFR
ncbi:MAG: hypothetical protein A2076_02870 [Geobacteraceae bacterium GWC2_53_11]|nr:MAG: hypothetical protein A2076_02870 [Geobacteraceae bacterium GWC2_53_11]